MIEPPAAATLERTFVLIFFACVFFNLLKVCFYITEVQRECQCNTVATINNWATAVKTSVHLLILLIGPPTTRRDTYLTRYYKYISF